MVMTADFESANLGSIPSKTSPNIAQMVEHSTVEVNRYRAVIGSNPIVRTTNKNKHKKQT